MRQLVSVRRISAIEPIRKADFVVCATVDGWKCVVQKNDFEVGDQCVYFEIDSFMTQGQERFEFLMKDKYEWNGQVGVRICTREFRGQVSQGLALPLSSFPEVQAMIAGLDDHAIRSIDFTAVVGVQKWERPIPQELEAAVISAKPSYIATTGEDRLQNIPEELAENAHKFYERTVKLDGYSTTVFFNSRFDQSGVCGHHWWYSEEVPNIYVEVIRSSGLLDAIRRYGRNIALQGELMGPDICGNTDNLPAPEFRLFAIWSIDESRYLNRAERDVVLADLQELGACVLQVPTLGVVRLGDMGTVDDILNLAVGPSLDPDVLREGEVWVALDGSHSFKVISNKYLITHKDA
jgi:RNA ligase (TIGR02306 family)